MTKIVLIGAGRLGFHLGKSILNSEMSLIQVYSRNLAHAQSIDASIGIADWDKIPPRADLYIIATPDDTIGEVAQKLSKIISQKATIVHVSGAKSSEILKPFFKHYGSLYPLQSFSKEKMVDFKKIPICIVGNTKKTEKLIQKIAKNISELVYIISDKDRLAIHVSAVFVNNFTNYLFQIGYELMGENKLPFEILYPLIAETAAKIKGNEPKSMQTGPAIRGDQSTILKHLEYLNEKPDLRELYLQLTHGINPRLK